MTNYEHLKNVPIKEAVIDIQCNLEDDDSRLLSHRRWINEQLADCLEDNWDSEGAKAVSEPAVSTTAAFLTKFDHETIGRPEIDADSDGWITLEWYLNSDNVVLVSFGPNGVGTFASLLNGLRCHGEFNINDKSIDKKVMALLRQFEDISTQA